MIDALRSTLITKVSTLLQHHPSSLAASVFGLMNSFHLCLSVNIHQGLPVFRTTACVSVMPAL